MKKQDSWDVFAACVFPKEALGTLMSPAFSCLLLSPIRRKWEGPGHLGLWRCQPGERALGLLSPSSKPQAAPVQGQPTPLPARTREFQDQRAP